MNTSDPTQALFFLAGTCFCMCMAYWTLTVRHGSPAILFAERLLRPRHPEWFQMAEEGQHLDPNQKPYRMLWAVQTFFPLVVSVAVTLAAYKWWF